MEVEKKIKEAPFEESHTTFPRENDIKCNPPHLPRVGPCSWMEAFHLQISSTLEHVPLFIAVFQRSKPTSHG